MLECRGRRAKFTLFFYSAPFDTNGFFLMISMGNEQAPMKIAGRLFCKQPCYEYFRHDGSWLSRGKGEIEVLGMKQCWHCLC